MSVKNTELKSIQVFLSYSHEDKEIVGTLKVSLEDIGFKVFLAHEDIETCKEWQDEILKNLKSCDVFIPYITPEFSKSPWTDQETGIALAYDKLIIPLQAGKVPYGFIGKIQGMKVSTLTHEKLGKQLVTINKVVIENITKLISKDERFKHWKTFIINLFVESESFNAANARASLLKSFEFSGKEINRICNAAISNSQIYGGFRAGPIVRKLAAKYKKAIGSKKYKELDTLLVRD